MLKELKRLPFDERNEQDFEDLTRKIRDALAKIRKTRSLPATQENLAELAGCTRKTLHNRSWPISELKKIKEERQDNKDNKPKNTIARHKISSGNYVERERLLIKRIKNFQEHNGKLFDRVQELEEQNAGLVDTVQILEDEIVSLKDENRKLEKELRKLKQSRNGKTNVVSIRAMKKIKGTNKEEK